MNTILATAIVTKQRTQWKTCDKGEGKKSSSGKLDKGELKTLGEQRNRINETWKEVAIPTIDDSTDPEISMGMKLRLSRVNGGVSILYH